MRGDNTATADFDVRHASVGGSAATGSAIAVSSRNPDDVTDRDGLDPREASTTSAATATRSALFCTPRRSVSRGVLGLVLVTADGGGVRVGRASGASPATPGQRRGVVALERGQELAEELLRALRQAAEPPLEAAELGRSMVGFVRRRRVGKAEELVGRHAEHHGQARQRIAARDGHAALEARERLGGHADGLGHLGLGEPACAPSLADGPGECIGDEVGHRLPTPALGWFIDLQVASRLVKNEKVDRPWRRIGRVRSWGKPLRWPKSSLVDDRRGR